MDSVPGLPGPRADHAPGRSHRPARAVLVLGLAAGVAGAQVQGTQPGTWLAGLFGSADRGDPARWAGGIDRGGTTRCRLGNCSTPANCVFNLSAREEILRSSYCMEERMERPYLGGRQRHARCRWLPRGPLPNGPSLSLACAMACHPHTAPVCLRGACGYALTSEAAVRGQGNTLTTMPRVCTRAGAAIPRCSTLAISSTRGAAICPSGRRLL